MTLAISLRIPDGIVMACDSLATVQSSIKVGGELAHTCENCGVENNITVAQLPPINVPSSIRSNAQKLNTFFGKYGVGFYGQAFVNGKSMWRHLIRFEQDNKDDAPATVEDAAKDFADYLNGQLIADLQAKELTVAMIPDDIYPFGFQLSGFDQDEGSSWSMEFGNHIKDGTHTESGVTFSGDTSVVHHKLFVETPDSNLPPLTSGLGAFSLQDAIDYSRFMIDTTAIYQRFANMIPTVGGEIDILMLAPFRNPVWIKQKRYSQLLEENK